MKEPREALEAARRAAASADQPVADGAPWSLERTALPSTKQLVEWAIIEPDPSEVYSTRRFGQPITAFKRLLIRLLYQYLGQMSSQQSRFNAHVAARVLHLEERVRVLEEAGADRSASSAPHQPEPRPGDESA